MSQPATWGVPRSGPATPAVMAERMDDALDALLSQNSGASEPAYAVAGTRWADTSVAGTITLKEYDGADWIVVGTIDTAANTFVPGASAAAVRSALGVNAAIQPLTDIASAATTDIGAVASENVNVTGTTPITSFGTAAAGTFRLVRFAGALTITHNATSLITTTGANIITAAGDIAPFISLGAGNWRMLAFVRAAQPVPPALAVSYESAEQTLTAGGLLTLAHSLGSKPKLAQLILVCKTANLGYSVDDEVFLNVGTSSVSGVSGQGVGTRFDATNIYVRIGTAGMVIVDSSGGGVAITLASWRLIVRAWA